MNPALRHVLLDSTALPAHQQGTGSWVSAASVSHLHLSLGTSGLWAPAPRSAHGKRRGGVGEWEQSIRDRDLLHPLHSHKSPLRSCLVRCQPADHSPPDLQARLSKCECLHPHLQHPESPPFQGLPERKHATKCPIEVSAKSRHSVSSTQQSASRAVAEPCPLSSQVPKMANNPYPQLLLFHRNKIFFKDQGT